MNAKEGKGVVKQNQIQLIRYISIGLAILFSVTLLLCKEASQAGVPESKNIQDHLRAELSKQYPGARIELDEKIEWEQEISVEQISKVQILNENARGEIRFSVNQEVEGTVSFSAWVPAWVAQKRIFPGERLSQDVFVLREVNVSTGLAREYRGVLLPKTANLSQLEARQSILEGQFALSSGVQKIPDVRKGEPVQIKLTAGGIILTTSGIAEEPSYIHQPVRVLTSKSKRSLTGKLMSDGTVEVKL